MKYLIMGCNGMAGHMVSLYLKEQGHDVTGFARRESDLVDTIVGDAADTDMIKCIIKNGNFDIVVNCIGILNKAAEADKADAVFLNAYLPHYLADITKESSSRIIHISTDCVFSGKRGQYLEDDLRDGETFYDRSKALGELEDDKNLTLRTSIVGPDRNEEGIGLLNWFMKQEGIVHGYSKVSWTGQTTLQLAKTIEYVSKNKIFGLYNAVPGTSISKYHLLMLFNKYISGNNVEIVSDDGVESDKSLINSKFDQYIIPSYEIMVKELAEWMKAHIGLYPHYKNKFI